MNKRRTKPLIPLLSGRWVRVGLTALLTAVVTVGLQAQATDEVYRQLPRDLNSELRTNTWSIYAQGGLSWATGVWYQSVDAKRSYSLAPAVGGGVDFTIRPWVRVGAEYLWSRYRREQRLSELDTKTMPIKSYGNYLMNYHNAKLGAGFNFMEFWPTRRAQWLNIWVGTGVGYTFAQGNEYGIYFSSTKTVGGTTTPFVDGEQISNDGSITITGSVQMKNRPEDFNTLYIPATLHVEADVSRRFTLGIKGEMNWMLNRKEIAPKNLIFALASVRYNFVMSRAQVEQIYYEGEITTLSDRVNDLRRELAESQAQAEQQRTELQRQLQACEEAKAALAAAMPTSHFVQFDHDSYQITPLEADRLRTFAHSVRGQQLSLVAEASTPGTADYNQELSERRLQSVVDLLVEEGFSREDLSPATAIGAQNNKPAATGRRVTITIIQSN